jgi:hypothetical protein
MPIAPDSQEFKRLMLQVETELLALARIRLLLSDDANLLHEWPPLVRPTQHDGTTSRRRLKQESPSVQALAADR